MFRCAVCHCCSSSLSPFHYWRWWCCLPCRHIYYRYWCYADTLPAILIAFAVHIPRACLRARWYYVSLICYTLYAVLSWWHMFHDIMLRYAVSLDAHMLLMPSLFFFMPDACLLPYAVSLLILLTMIYALSLPLSRFFRHADAMPDIACSRHYFLLCPAHIDISPAFHSVVIYALYGGFIDMLLCFTRERCLRGAVWFARVLIRRVLLSPFCSLMLMLMIAMPRAKSAPRYICAHAALLLPRSIPMLFTVLIHYLIWFRSSPAMILLYAVLDTPCAPYCLPPLFSRSRDICLFCPRERVATILRHLLRERVYAYWVLMPWWLSPWCCRLCWDISPLSPYYAATPAPIYRQLSALRWAHAYPSCSCLRCCSMILLRLPSMLPQDAVWCLFLSRAPALVCRHHLFYGARFVWEEPQQVAHIYWAPHTRLSGAMSPRAIERLRQRWCAVPAMPQERDFMMIWYAKALRARLLLLFCSRRYFCRAPVSVLHKSAHRLLYTYIDSAVRDAKDMRSAAPCWCRAMSARGCRRKML